MRRGRCNSRLKEQTRDQVDRLIRFESKDPPLEPDRQAKVENLSDWKPPPPRNETTSSLAELRVHSDGTEAVERSWYRS